MRKRRYSGHDSHFGPFTFSRHNDGSWRPLGLVLDSGGSDLSGRPEGCHLKLHGFGYTLIVELPRLLPDFRVRHVAGWDEATVARMGRNWYDEVFSREYGFTFHDGNLHTYFGPQTHDSVTTKSRVFFLPWCNWRFVRQSWYDRDGKHIETLWQTSSPDVRAAQFEWRREFEANLDKVWFEFKDSDGQVIQAATHIEEREWRFGTGLFSWLSLFRRPRIVRSLDLEFSAEVGPEKGSWKGGTRGRGINMLPGESHEEAFRRYCSLEHRSKYGNYRLTFIGEANHA